MKDLVAIATVRRLLLELGYEMQPEELDVRMGPLSLWVAEPRSDLEGVTPIAALAEPDGENRIRECLIRIMATMKPLPSSAATSSPQSVN